MVQRQQTRGHLDPGLIWGLMFILFGVMILGPFRAEDAFSYWPFTVILLGVIKLLDPPPSGGRPHSLRPGAWLLFIGLWGMVSEFALFGFDYSNSWPLVIIGFGLMLVWRSFEGPDICTRHQKGQHS